MTFYVALKKKRLDFRSVVFKCKFGTRPRHKAHYRAVVSSEAFGDSCNPPSTQRIHFLTYYSGTRYPAPACFLKSWAITHFLRVELTIPVEQTSQQGRTKDRRGRAWDKHVPFSVPSSPLGKIISPWKGATWTSKWEDLTGKEHWPHRCDSVGAPDPMMEGKYPLLHMFLYIHMCVSAHTHTQ